MSATADTMSEVLVQLESVKCDLVQLYLEGGDEIPKVSGAPFEDNGDVSQGESQIDLLADYIMQNIEGEPSRSEGAGDCATRLLKHLIMDNETLRKGAKSGHD